MSYYQMHRGWMDHPAFGKEPYSRAQAWCWLIENAVWKERRVPVEGGIFTLQRGQLAFSLRYLAKAWSWQSDKRVRIFLSHLQSDEMVRIESGPKTDAGEDAGRTVLTICNYDKYQAPLETADAPKDAARTHLGRKEEEVKEVKEESRSDARSVKAVIFDKGRFKSQDGGDGFKAPPTWADKYRDEGWQSPKPRGVLPTPADGTRTAPAGDLGKPPEERPAKAEDLAFDGSVIRLTEAAYRRWQRDYYTVRDIRSELASLDKDFAANLAGRARKMWFAQASAALARVHRANLRARVVKNPSPELPMTIEGTGRGRPT